MTTSNTSTKTEEATLDEAIKRLRQANLPTRKRSRSISSELGSIHVALEAIALLGAEDEQGPEVSVAGRIVAFRQWGRLPS